MGVKEMVNYLENGNIKNSVNYPALDMGVCEKAGRVAVFHKNIANMITKLTGCFGDVDINISDMLSKSRGDFAVSMFDIEEPATEAVINKIAAVNGVFRVRVVK